MSTGREGKRKDYANKDTVMLRDCCIQNQTRGIAIATVFEQWWCVDWLRTATVYTKQTTGCPRWDCGVSDTLILPHTFSLYSAYG